MSSGKLPNMTKADQIPGGLADDKSPKDFDQEQLNAGIKVEMEHTDDEDIAREIAMDHLTEDKDYYKKLKKIEKSDVQSGQFKSPIFHYSGYTQVPGQTPFIQQPPSIRYTIDPELIGIKETWDINKVDDRPVWRVDQIVQNVGLPQDKERKLQVMLASELQIAHNPATAMGSIMRQMMEEGVPPELRTLITYRTRKYMENQKRPRDMAKGVSRGGKYHHRVTKDGKHKYYYDPSKYEKAEGIHTTGEEEKKKFVESSVYGHICKFNDSGCIIAELKDLVGAHGHQAVHEAVKGLVGAGKVSYKENRFFRNSKGEK